MKPLTITHYGFNPRGQRCGNRGRMLAFALHDLWRNMPEHPATFFACANKECDEAGRGGKLCAKCVTACIADITDSPGAAVEMRQKISDVRDAAAVLRAMVEPAKEPEPVKFRAGDTVHHEPSDEDWTLANDEEDGRVSPSGWPATIANAKDCRMLKPASETERIHALQAWAKKGLGHEHERDHRTLTARRQLNTHDH